MNGYELVRLQPNQLKKTGDTMTGDLKMSANIVPTTNNARDLGSASLSFRKVYGSATSADKLTTARGFSINGVRKTFNGESDISWSLAEIGAATTNHNQASNTITAMTGYTKGSSSSAIASSDTLNSAIGKLENKVDSKANSTHTHNYAGSATAGGAANSALTCTGNSATATKLQTARNINGVAFDGTKDITIADNTKLPLTGGTVKGHVECQSLSVPNTVELSMQIKSVYDGTPNRLSLQGATNKDEARIKFGSGAEISSGAGESRLIIGGGLYTNGFVEGVQVRSNGPIFPTSNAHGGWDCGLITNRFYTVYCVNVNQSSDRNLKKDIHYLDDVNSLSKDIKSETPFKDFIKDELRIATYKYKRQEFIKNEDGTTTAREMPNKEVDSQIGFIAQDIRNTEVGSLFVYGEDGNMNYSPSGFTSVVAKALQEEIKYRDKQIDLLEAKINSLEKKIDALAS